MVFFAVVFFWGLFGCCFLVVFLAVVFSQLFVVAFLFGNFCVFLRRGLFWPSFSLVVLS